MTDRRTLLQLAGSAGVVATMATGATGATAEAAGEGASGLLKTGVLNPDKNPRTGPHAVRLKNVREWLVFAGHAALGRNDEIVHPGNALEQLRWIFASLGHTLDQEGYSFADVVQLKMTCVAEVTLAERVKFLEVVGEVFRKQSVPPMGATMSVVHGLMYPGMLVEVDIWAAR